MNCVSLIFTLCCVCLFLYKSYECVDKYLESEMVTQTAEENQEDYPPPQICINQHRIPDEKLESLNITYTEYTKQGKWKINGFKMKEEIIYEYLSSSFTDLVHKVVLSRMSQSTSNEYERVTFHAMEDNRMILSRLIVMTN